MLRQSITRNSWLLAAFAVCTALLIAGTYLSTRERIAEQKRMAEEKALLEIIPRERHDNSMLDDVIAVGPEAAGLGLAETRRIFLARRGEAVVAAIIPVTAPDGYSGDIELIVGVNADGSIAGVRVLSHKETPGLGDKVDLRKSDWILGFNGRSLNNPELAGWAVRKDKGVFDQFTGATITPRAVVAATLRALQFADAHSKTLFARPGDAKDAGPVTGPETVSDEGEQ
jgi:electron transport complex protein RnfG